MLKFKGKITDIGKLLTTNYYYIIIYGNYIYNTNIKSENLKIILKFKYPDKYANKIYKIYNNKKTKIFILDKNFELIKII